MSGWVALSSLIISCTCTRASTPILYTTDEKTERLCLLVCVCVSVCVSVCLCLCLCVSVCRCVGVLRWQLRRDLAGLQQENHRLHETLLQVRQPLETHVKQTSVRVRPLRVEVRARVLCAHHTTNTTEGPYALISARLHQYLFEQAAEQACLQERGGRELRHEHERTRRLFREFIHHTSQAG